MSKSGAGEHTCFTLSTGSAQPEESVASVCLYTQIPFFISTPALSGCISATHQAWIFLCTSSGGVHWTIALDGRCSYKTVIALSSQASHSLPSLAVPRSTSPNILLLFIFSYGIFFRDFNRSFFFFFFFLFKRSSSDQYWAVLRSCIHCHSKWFSSKPAPSYFP